MAIIGIDLGTSNSLVSVWRENGVELIPNGLGEVLTPSAVSIDDDGSLLVGQAARERLISVPEKSAAEFKRFMGTNKKYFLGENAYTPEDLSSFVLRKLKEDAEAYLAATSPGESITEAVVSVPAYFNDNQRAATKRAGVLAGLTVERILNEPSAAALTCRLYDQETDFTALIFDFGGGTLDVSVVDCFDNMVSVLAVAGDNQLGGTDFDRQIAQAFCTANNLHFEQLSPLTQASLLYQAERAKHRLSVAETTLIHIPDGEASGRLELTNQKLVDISASLFQRMGIPLRRALADSKKRLDDIARVVLVGGSCKMPVVQGYLRQLLGREMENPFSPDTVVGLGTGVYAGIRERRECIRDIVMTDLCPFTLGTGVINNADRTQPRFSPIIERNSILPCSKVERYNTVANNQTKLKVDVYQGEERYCKDNLLLGKLDVDVPPAPAGEESVDVRFTYDINGILEVEVTVTSTGQTYREVFLGKNSSLTEEEVRVRLRQLSGLKIPPQEKDSVRTLLALAERLYAQSTGPARQAVADALDTFRAAVGTEAPTIVSREMGNFKAFLQSVEKRILGMGLLPSDFPENEEEDPWEETRPPALPERGGNSGTPLQ